MNKRTMILIPAAALLIALLLPCSIFAQGGGGGSIPCCNRDLRINVSSNPLNVPVMSFILVKTFLTAQLRALHVVLFSNAIPADSQFERPMVLPNRKLNYMA
jgi:hypothetical protein